MRPRQDHQLRVVVSGMLAAVPYQGGATWTVLQFILGLRSLGHEVLFVEPVPAEALCPDSPSVRYLREVVAEFGLDGQAALLVEGTNETMGVSAVEAARFSATADVLLNLSGVLADPRIFDAIPVRVYVDLDPLFTQVWREQGVDMRFAGHTHFVTIGQAIGSAGCRIPTGGIPWITMLQPVALEQWPPAGRVTRPALTTIANWRGYGSVWDGDIQYGQKVHSLRPLMGLPRRSPKPLELALAIHPDEVEDLSALRREGWHLVDPSRVAGTPDDYRRYIQGSWAEFGIAKSGYTLSRSGWVSDRSVCYLASGRPVLAQDTGLREYLPVGEGLLTFGTEDEALAGIDDIKSGYRRHRRAARAIAEEYLDARIVLSKLLDRVGEAA